jgi:hypothetical protein
MSAVEAKASLSEVAGRQSQAGRSRVSYLYFCTDHPEARIVHRELWSRMKGVFSNNDLG